MSNLFEKLNSINVNFYTHEKEGLTYLNWASAVRIIQQHTDDFSYKFIDNEDGLPFFDSPIGIFVKTEITIEGVTKSMTLPVLDFKNNPMYSTEGKIIRFKKEIDRPVASCFDINSAQMRCLVKNLAMFGLGLYIYEGFKSPEAADIKDAKIISKEKIELEKKKKLWGDFNESLKDNDVDVEGFLKFNKIKMTEKAKLMVFVQEFLSDNDLQVELISKYKESLEG